MKKILLLAMCMLIYGIITQAQIFIPKLGASLSNISFAENSTTENDFKNKLGIVGGFAVELPLTNKISLQPELLFVQKGYKGSTALHDDDFGNGTAEGSVTINYLEVPVLAKVKFGSFYINAGPSMAIGLGGKFKSSATYPGQPVETWEGKIKFGKRPESDVTSTDWYVDNKIDIGLQIGAGYLIAHKVMIDLRYGFGMINLYEKRPGYGDNKSKLRSFQVTVGIPIRSGKK